MENNSLIIVDEKSIVVKNQSEIVFKDFEALVELVSENVAKYKGIVFEGEDAIKEAKTIKAQFNKDKKLLNKLRKEVKNEVMKPYETLESQVKTICGLYDEAQGNIETQITTFETELKANKRLEYIEYFNELLNVYQEADFLYIEDIEQSSWLLKGISMKKIRTEIEEKVNKIANDMKIINMDQLGGRIVSIYKTNGFDLASAKEEVLQRIKREQEEQARIDAQMEAKNLVVDESKIEEIKKEVVEEINNPDEVVSEQLELTFTVVGEKTVLKQVKQYLLNLQEEGKIKVK